MDPLDLLLLASPPAIPTPDSDQSSRRRRRTNPRKGHTKSRKGCYNCKRRKIKCQETLPTCANCERASLRCLYPDRPVIGAIQHNPRPQVALSNESPSFTLTDMRLFHHYLSTAYPHFPLSSESTWLNYITPIGHQCEYLMHALLALSASHLEKLAPSSLTPVARSHARAAMAGLNSALGQPFLTPESGDAAIAACYALMMQSWYMDDGLSSFLILSRSCQSVAGLVKGSGVDAVFVKEDRRTKVERIRDRIEKAPHFNQSFKEHAQESLEALRQLCKKQFELDMIEKLGQCFETLCKSPYQAYLHHVEVDEMITGMDSEECQQLLDSNDQVCQILLAHMIAMYLIMRPVSCNERRYYTATMYGIRMTSWIERISSNLDERLAAFVQWPLMVSELNKNKILEQYTLSEGGVARWNKRFIDGSTLSPPARAAVMNSPMGLMAASSGQASIASSPFLLESSSSDE